MKTVWLRGLEVGAGAPKVIVPIVGRTREDILTQAARVLEAAPDAAEWRVDFYEDVSRLPRVLDTLRALREALGELPVLFTFRTRREGGERELSPEDYRALNLAAAQSGEADGVDVEIFFGEREVRQIIDGVHAAGKVVVGSSHDHSGTPPREELIARLRRAQDLGADLPKLAVMPQSRADVLTLLSASEEMARLWADRPIITMSMAGDGAVSRLCGEVFGSAMTFGTAGRSSAPGQLPVEELRLVLDILHRSLNPEKEGGQLRDSYIREAIHYMERNYRRELTVEELAGVCGLNRSYFSKIFKESMGCPPQEFLIRLRLSKAADWLKGSGRPIGEVSALCGYPNQLHFSRSFRKRYGMSPREWRARNQIKQKR